MIRWGGWGELPEGSAVITHFHSNINEPREATHRRTIDERRSLVPQKYLNVGSNVIMSGVSSEAKQPTLIWEGRRNAERNCVGGWSGVVDCVCVVVNGKVSRAHLMRFTYFFVKMYIEFLMYVAASYPRVHQHRRTAERWKTFRERARKVMGNDSAQYLVHCWFD